ncbi:MAG: hypothetical protein Q7T51_02500 [Candidatus Moranbacteria bacterium]|nr:hypothetical protein [Candidatus Moranbacteria bacterium]
MILGFSSGCLHKTHDRMAKGTFDVFRKLGCNAIEIMCYDVESVSRLAEISLDDLQGFEHISLHAPLLQEVSAEDLEGVLRQIEVAQKRIGFAYVVVHPDKSIDWKTLSKFAIPFAVENMDNRKDFYRNVADLQELFAQFDAKMVLDLNHCFVNDSTMQLAKEFVKAFPDRIAGIHLSGFETFHDPLHKTQQQEILDAVFNKNIPIIIESGCETELDVEKEYLYVKNKLSN